MREQPNQELERYLPEPTRREDFDAFWSQTLLKAQGQPLLPEYHETAYPLPTAKVYDIRYCGFDSTPIHGYFVLPCFGGLPDQLPCAIHFHGYGGSRGYPSQLLPWVMMGMAVLSIDCREQGGLTGNLVPSSSGVIGNISTKGILDEQAYYYRAVYMDCVKAIDFALSCPQVDPARIIVRGTSQGGGLAIATAALDNRPAAVIAHVPSQSNLERRVEGSHGSYASVHAYLAAYPHQKERVYQTLSYFDTMNLADRIACPVYASVSLKDSTCPAECFFASYNRIPSAKQIQVYPFNNHHDASQLQIEAELEWLGNFLSSY